MKRYSRFIVGLISAAALAAGTAAHAESGCDHMGASDGGKYGMRHGDMKDAMTGMAERAEKRLGHFKDELKITPQQETMWLAYADKVKQSVGSGMKNMHDKMSDASLAATERLDRMDAIMKERLAAMEATTESFKRLYASLTPEQKATADKHMSHMGQMSTHDQPGPGGKPDDHHHD